MADGFDAYRTLQVDPAADPEVIQAAYRRLAQKYHPDVAPGGGAVAAMIAINRAWEILGDPDRRAAYDAERSGSRPGSGSTQAGESQPRPGARTAGRSSAHATGRNSADTAPTDSERRMRPPEEVSRDWTSGRPSAGSGYHPSSMRTPDGEAAAGAPPGNPSGSVLNFGRYAGWSLSEIARLDLDYLEWLDRMPIGRVYRDEIDGILRRTGRRRSAAAEAAERRGLFRRR